MGEECVLNIWLMLANRHFAVYSVKGTIERYKKACSGSSDTGSVSELNAQVMWITSKNNIHVI